MSTKFNDAGVCVVGGLAILVLPADEPGCSGPRCPPARRHARHTLGGAFVAGGWQVKTKDDTIYWHVPTIANGAAQFDVRGLNPNEFRAGMEDKTELFHMHDYTFGSSDINYNGG